LLRTGGRENGDLGAVTPYSWVPFNPHNPQISETLILIRWLRIIFCGTGNSAQLSQNSGISGGVLKPPPVRHCFQGSLLINLQGKAVQSYN
jgi:hypothetical protein